MEKHREVAVVKAEFDWNDIGSWNALGALTPPDQDGNRRVGEAVLIDTRDCYVQSDSRVVATVGVNNLVVVDTPDALLVADAVLTRESEMSCQFADTVVFGRWKSGPIAQPATAMSTEMRRSRRLSALGRCVRRTDLLSRTVLYGTVGRPFS